MNLAAAAAPAEAPAEIFAIGRVRGEVMLAFPHILKHQETTVLNKVL